MSNLKPAPIQLTPQVTRGCLGIGHPKRMAELDVKTLDQIAGEAKSKDWITERRERLAGAIAYLRSCAVLVDQNDKRDLVASYWVSGVRQPQLAEDVIALAKRKGWSE